MARSPDPAKPFRIGLNETQVGLVAPEGIQRLLRRVVGTHRAERLLVGGMMPTTDEALAIGLVDEACPVDDAGPRAVAWAQALAALPRQPVLDTRAIARADAIEALDPGNVRLDRFIESWYSADTQTALRSVLERLGNGR
jgi:enoyl-CoA hydratase/carnithine racemase